MGAGPSKTAAQSTVRKFPNRAPGAAVPPSRRPPPPPVSNAVRGGVKGAPPEDPYVSRAREDPVASQFQPEAVHEDAGDRDRPLTGTETMNTALAARLRTIGVVQPNPTFSPSSTADPIPSPLQQTDNSGPIFPASSENAVLSALEARRMIDQQAEQEMQNTGLSRVEGRRFLNAGMIREVLVMRERGASEAQIEERFNLKKGVLVALGPNGLYRPAGGAQPVP